MSKRMAEKRIFASVFILMFALFAYYKTFIYDAGDTDNVLAYQEVVINEDLEEKPNEIIELRKQYNNDDIVGKVIVENTNINELILKHTDNDFYLHHDNYGNYEINGSIFLDYRINIDDRKLLIFGHSSIYDDIPFNELENYYKKAYYKDHKYIDVITETENYKYEIFSVYVETSDFTYMNLKISDETYNKFLKEYKERSLYDTGVDVEDNDDILILQTCSNSSKYKNYKKKYLLVIARKIRMEENK